MRVLFHDSSTSLITGVLSDVHLLALMYAGEICFWLHTQLPDSTPAAPVLSIADVSELAASHLLKFVHIISADPVLRESRWNVATAQAMLQKLGASQ